MAGNSRRRSSSLSSVAIPAALATTEATWVALCVEAATSADPAADLHVGFVAFALPATAAVALVVLSGNLAVPRWVRAGGLAGALLVVTGLCAGLVGAHAVAGLFAAVGLHPWTTTGVRDADVAAMSWFVASLSVGRGLVLAARPLSFPHAARSVTISLLAFVVVFIVLGASHAPALHRAVADPAAWFVVFFVCAIGVLALVRERDIERAAQLRSPSRPTTAWFAVLAVPTALVAGAALLIAAFAGPLAPLIGRALLRGAAAVVVGIGIALMWLIDLLPRTKRPRSIPTLRGGPPAALHGPAHVSGGLAVLAVVFAACLAALVVLAIALFAMRVRIRLRRRTGEGVAELDEEVDSVFSWHHLLEQLLAALRRIPRRRRRAPERPLTHPDVPAAAEHGVRGEYRRFLRAVRAEGLGREPVETTSELERRLRTSGPLAKAESDLARLTALYDEARYGAGGGAQADRDARRHVERLAATLLEHGDER